LLYCFRNVRLDPWDAMEWAKRKRKKEKDRLNCCRYFYLFHSISIKRKW
jgi:hypothetical protein